MVAADFVGELLFGLADLAAAGLCLAVGELLVAVVGAEFVGVVVPPPRSTEAFWPNCGGVTARIAPRLPIVPVAISTARFIFYLLLTMKCKSFVMKTVLWNSYIASSFANCIHKWRWSADINIRISKSWHNSHNVFSIHRMF